MDKNYGHTAYYAEQIDKISNKYCPVTKTGTKAELGEDELIEMLRELAEHKGFIIGYDVAVQMVAKLFEEYIHKKDMTFIGIKKALDKLLSCEED